MKKALFVLFFLIQYSTGYTQVTGRVLAGNGDPIPNVAVFFEKTDLYSFTDSLGYYQIETPKNKGFLYFSKENYDTYEIKWTDKDKLSYLEVQLKKSKSNIFDYHPKDPFASFVILATREKAKKYDGDIYSGEYYSKGSIQLNTEKTYFLGQKRRDLDPSLNTYLLSQNYIYLAELSSNITYQSVYRVRENVLGLRESGDMKNLKFLTATDANFDFYHREVSNAVKIVSPLSVSAEGYYNFRWIRSFEIEGGQTVYQIKVFPKREGEPVMDGNIYIVKDDWQIYAVEANIKASNLGIENIENLYLQQFYTYNKDSQSWVKEKQTLDVSGKFLVFDFFGRFQSVYYNFKPMEKFTFKKELIDYSSDFDRQSDYFWIMKRKSPLSPIEKRNFDFTELFKQEESEELLHSIDKQNNSFTLFKLIKGYEHHNTFNNTKISYRGLLSTFAFNAIQGFNVTSGLSYTRNRLDHRKTELGALINYGIEESKPRFSGYASHIFNQKNYHTLQIAGGMIVEQFGEEQAPIKNIINSVSAAWFGKNYAKYYLKEYLKMAYTQYAFTGLHIKASFEYAHRRPLHNAILSPPFVPSLYFTSNNPVKPTNFQDHAFESNHIFKLSLGTQIVFDQKIINYPDKKVYLKNSRYPILSLNLEKGLSPSSSIYNYTFFSISSLYQRHLGRFGFLSFFIDSGKFLEQNNIAFMDYKHFYGNQTPIGSQAIYDRQFNLLPYYDFSTNKTYFQYHMEHDFKGFILNKIPFMNQTGFSLVVGFHHLNTSDRKPYQEFSIGLNNIGFRKLRPFRIDYVRSHYDGGFQNHGIIIGVKLLDLIQK